MHLTHQPIHKRNPGHTKQHAAQSLPAAIVQRQPGGDAHEDVAYAVDVHDVIDELLIAGDAEIFEVEEGEGVVGPEEAVYTEADGDDAEDIGDEADGGMLRERHDGCV